MEAVMIRDAEPQGRFLAVDLRHILAALGQRALRSEWRVRDVWASGNASPDLENLDERRLVSGQRLADLAQNVVQIMDGTFKAYDPEDISPWIIVEARDSLTTRCIPASHPFSTVFRKASESSALMTTKSTNQTL